MITLKDAAKLVGLDYNGIRAARSRCPEIWRSDYFGVPRKGDGNVRLVGRSGLIWLAIWGRLLAFGIPHRAAAEAAWHFTEFGDVVTGWTEEGPLPEPARGPCELHADGRTLLQIYPLEPGYIDDGLTLSGGKLKVKLVHWRDGCLGEALTEAGSLSPLLIDLNKLLAEIDAKLASLPKEMKQRRREAMMAQIEPHKATCEG